MMKSMVAVSWALVGMALMIYIVVALGIYFDNRSEDD